MYQRAMGVLLCGGRRLPQAGTRLSLLVGLFLTLSWLHTAYSTSIEKKLSTKILDTRISHERQRRDTSGNVSGRDGRDGRDGVRGPQGPAGPPGPPGPQGVSGPAGRGLTPDELKRVLTQVINISKSADTVVVSKNIRASGGVVYTRWGRDDCRDNVDLVYTGYVGGKNHLHVGGGTDYLCLPKVPQFGKVTPGCQSGSYIYGTEYEINTSNNPFNGPTLKDNDVVCAVCHVGDRSTQLMIPAWKSCPAGWTQEYTGYLMSQHYTQTASSFICVDQNPEKAEGGHENKNGALLYNVEAICGSLPCPKYREGAELTCVVCTK